MSQLLIEKIDAILPQTQCKKCGFAGCRPYAEAIVEGGADINQCPPGGQQGIQKLLSYWIFRLNRSIRCMAIQDPIKLLPG